MTHSCRVKVKGCFPYPAMALPTLNPRRSKTWRMRKLRMFDDDDDDGMRCAFLLKNDDDEL